MRDLMIFSYLSTKYPNNEKINPTDNGSDNVFCGKAGLES